MLFLKVYNMQLAEVLGFLLHTLGLKMLAFLSFSADQSAISSSVVDNGQVTNVTINGGIVPELANFNMCRSY